MTETPAERHDVIRELADELVDLLENGEQAEVRFSAAAQLCSMDRPEQAIAAFGALIDAPSGELRTRAAAQLGRIGAPAIEAFGPLARAAVNREDDGLALAAVEALNRIDPENLVGAPQVVRLLRRRTLRMWRCGAFLQVRVDEELLSRMVRALATNGRFSEEAQLELERLEATTSSGRVRAVVREVLRSFAALPG